MSIKSKRNLQAVECLDVDEVEEEGFIEGDINFDDAIAVFNFGSEPKPVNIEAPVQVKLSQEKKDHSQLTEEQSYSTSPRGITPPVDGEHFTVKRCYQFRRSPLRKLNELKASHPDLNVYLNTILDEAILCYYDHIFNKNGS